MKSILYFRLTVSLVFILSVVNTVFACGPYNPIIPTPEFFKKNADYKSISQQEREENIKLWQRLTSERIPLSDIEEVVYSASWDDYLDHTGWNPKKTNNLFYRYLNNSSDGEIIGFLLLAKDMERRWKAIRSPWYYPSSRESNPETGDFHDILEECQAYEGTRLKDRYGLQAVRALFASRCYSKCVDYYDSVFTSIPDDNLMKRMAQRYVAGCWSRLGEEERADSLFAKAGDIWSLSQYQNKLEYMAQHKPNAPQLIAYIRSRCDDKGFMCDAAKEAGRLVTRKDVSNKGDWYYLMAYVNNENLDNRGLAMKYIRLAERNGNFSSAELRDLCRAYRMKLDAQSGNKQLLLADLKWIECQTDIMNEDRNEWVRILQNIVYVDWIPQLWRKKDYSTAILLCSYADNLGEYDRWHEAWREIGSHVYGYPINTLSNEEMRDSEVYSNHNDYGSLSFQMMGSLSSSQLASVYNTISGNNSALYRHMKSNVRTDSDYYNELIGTLALREEAYDRAVSYLSKVSERYQRTMNLYKGGYFSREVFTPYDCRWSKYGQSDWEYESSTINHKREPKINAKLVFAKDMQKLKRQMQSGKTADERGLARLTYAIGRRNSFEECWALTQYWRGWVGIFDPVLQYWEDNFDDKYYSFLYDYEQTIGHKKTEEIYNREIEAALAMLQTDEARAKAEYILGNLITVVKKYGNTSTAAYVKTSCDNWRNWL